MTILCVKNKSHLPFICRCTVQECSGTLTWPLSWSWPLKMTDYLSSRCGTSGLPHRPSKCLRTTQGDFFFFLTERIVLNVFMILSNKLFLAPSVTPRGILSISWSQADSELLLSSAKDNRILCWNPNTGEVHLSSAASLLFLLYPNLCFNPDLFS